MVQDVPDAHGRCVIWDLTPGSYDRALARIRATRAIGDRSRLSPARVDELRPLITDDHAGGDGGHDADAPCDWTCLHEGSGTSDPRDGDFGWIRADDGDGFDQFTADDLRDDWFPLAG